MMDQKMRALQKNLENSANNQEGALDKINEAIRQSMKKYQDDATQIQRKIEQQLDDKMQDARNQAEELDKKVTNTIKQDYESLIKVLGQNTQDAVLKMKQDLNLNI
mmetsp:Transcript_42096/g.40354  ORF Transcript_42096/g.40354 Transcript_42096/m.40354 type:complete len:106 (-) Transcript_42096:12-329(-)